MRYVIISVAILTVCFSTGLASAQNKVVVVPLGGAPGNASADDVVEGKTFSSNAGKGLTGTLVLPPGAQTFTNSIGMTFNLIPTGTFIMGSPEDEPGRFIDETQHQVTLTKPFYMQVTEVTQQQWQEVIGNNPAVSNLGAEYPIEYINWFEAAYFANALSQKEGRSQCYTLTGCSPDPGNEMECTGVSIITNCTGYRLPTESQWEYAARAGTTTAYANPYSFDATNTEIYDGFNSNLAAMGWYVWNDTNGGYPSGTKPVAQKQANRWGLYDMHGNVWEWCQDWYADYPTGTVNDPQGLADGSQRVVRGGSWIHNAWIARSAFRYGNSPGYRGFIHGFRLTLPPGQ